MQPRLDLCDCCLRLLPREPEPWRSGPAPIDFSLSPWGYAYPVDALVRQLKFLGDRAPARVLGTLLALERRELDRALPDLLLPVPLHPARLRERGYNQAAEIAIFAARILDLRVDTTLLERRRATQEQSSLPAALRAANVAGAFSADAHVAGRHLALLDDVITTGGTAQAAASALLLAGARSVELWTLARAGRRRLR
jgi:ComF family protein